MAKATPAPPPNIPQVIVERALIQKLGLWEFVKYAWPEIEPSPLVESWHLVEICKHLEAVSRGECKRLIINVPPGMSKSTLVSVLWPVWDWLTHPMRKWMVATWDVDLMRRDAVRCRRLMRSEWFLERFGDLVSLDETDDSQTTQAIFSTKAGGRRVSVTVGGKAIGWHADIQVIDDPTKPRDVQGDPDTARDALDRTWQWWTGTMASRRADPKRFARVIIMQRLAQTDLVGRILENDQGEWTHLMLPMRYEPERRCKTKWGGDIRKKAGELLCPERLDEASAKELERDLGSQVAAAQLQQRPAPMGGNIFQRTWFTERWKELPSDATLIISVDATFKDSAGSDFVALHVWGYCRGKYYFVDRIHDRMGLPETVRCMRALSKRYPNARAKLIEDKANGPAVEQSLRQEMTGIILVTPQGGKVARANAVAPLFEAGNVLFPDPSVREWIDDVLEEMVTFPFARNDDDVDACTQALIYLHDHSQSRYVEAMRRVASGQVKL